ncbi:uncharacterized protein LOC106875974 isoform X2 [Octopus bimaculoides]|uniref:uncharacterized protein LOC106875974 isoform X2 n=1 Tax=Octopus bimaculoides TaxID=37653 RepID=UPI0022E594D8|nr:uncharacterized protein LOC106875974 isoform X2 [Octopus bimaculoides]
MIFVLIFLLTTLNSGETTDCPASGKVTPDNLLHYSLYKTDCCNANLEVFKPFSDGKFPEKPKILQLTDFLQNGKKGIKAVWSANFTRLKGFRIEYEFQDSSKNICRILDFSKSLKNKSISNYNFEFEIYPMRKNRIYLVHLYSLPESGNNYLPARKVDTFMCREWTTPIDYRLKEDKLIVDFEQGPSKCNIKMYKVALHYTNSTILNMVAVNSSKTTSRLTHDFLGICPGSYYITVEIFDENPFTNCICINLNEKCGEGCVRTRTNSIEKIGQSCLEVTTTTSPSTKEPPNPPKLTIFLAVVGATVGLLLLGLTVYCLKRTLQEKRGLLFYTEDHSYHCEAINQFISFMDKNKCKLEVAAHLVKGDNPLKLSFEIQKSDFIILVYSKALHKRIQAWKSNQDYVNFLKEDNSALLTTSILKELQASNKLTICMFPQAPNSSISSEFPSVKCYTLTKELNLLIQEIHGTGVDQELAVLVRSNKLNHKFNSLTNTIKDAANFEETSPNWFEDKYICPKKIESLNEMPDYSEKFVDGGEHSIYSLPVSDILEQINAKNDSVA